MTASWATTLAFAIGWFAGAHLDADGAPGRIARAALLGEALTSTELSSDLSDADRLRLRGWLERRASSKAPHPVRDMLALVDTPGAEASAPAAAAALASARRAPESVIAACESYLRAEASSPLAPYIYAVMALQSRAAIEQAPGQAARERHARRYRTMLDRLRGQDDGIWRLIADDLDRMPSVTGTAAVHPREFLPPG